jgi:outer membrane lipoprotein-sorting protein
MPSGRTVAAALCVLALVVLAGCSLVPSASPGTDAPSTVDVPDGESAASAYRDLGNVTGDLAVSVAYGDRTERATFSFAADVGTPRVRQRVTSPSDRQGNLFVSNADAYWSYNASRDVAGRYGHGPGTFRSTFGAGNETFAVFLASAFDAAATDGTVSDLPEVGVGPAPTVALGDGERAGTGGENARDDRRRPTANVSEWTVSFQGTATVADRETYVLVVEPADPDEVRASNLSITYRVDAETYFPLQVTRQATIDGERWRHEMTFRNVNYDVDLDADTYRFEPDSETRVVDFTEAVVQFPTREALAANVSVDLPDPEVPDGFEFSHGAAITLNTTGAQLVYVNDSAAVIAGRYVHDGVIRPAERRAGMNTTVDGKRAFTVDLGRTSAVYVYCADGVVSAASVGPVPNETLFDVVRSLSCPANDTDARNGGGADARSDGGAGARSDGGAGALVRLDFVDSARQARERAPAGSRVRADGSVSE